MVPGKSGAMILLCRLKEAFNSIEVLQEGGLTNVSKNSYLRLSGSGFFLYGLDVCPSGEALRDEHLRQQPLYHRSQGLGEAYHLEVQNYPGWKNATCSDQDSSELPSGRLLPIL